MAQAHELSADCQPSIEATLIAKIIAATATPSVLLNLPNRANASESSRVARIAQCRSEFGMSNGAYASNSLLPV